jgi:hypothetical protein
MAVVVGEVCPIQTWMLRTLTPASNRWVAQEWRSEWTLAMRKYWRSCSSVSWSGGVP